ncbi:phytoene/squalene synthase family protein [soil metagenome]
MTHYASAEDIEICRKIHQEFGTTYYFSTMRLPEMYRRRVHSIYAFVRVPDEWVDNGGDLTASEQVGRLKDWHEQMIGGLNGVRPEHPAMRAFVDTLTECRIPMEEPSVFLDAMRMDVEVNRYETYADLQKYMRGSASAIGVMMCYAMGAPTDDDTLVRAMALGEAMQLTNFLRDVGEDLGRGRIYLPLGDCAQFGVQESDILEQKVTPNFKALMQYQIDRARGLYAYSDFGLQKLPDRMRKGILLARLLYSQILDRIEDNDYDVFSRRARTTLPQKVLCASRVAISHDRIVERMGALSENR